MRIRNRGSVIVEALISVGVLVLLAAFFLETARRTLYEVRAHWAGFRLAREAVIVGPRVAESRVRKAYLGTRFGLTSQQGFEARVIHGLRSKKVEGRAFLRFDSLHPFDVWNGRKRAFQLVRKCTFSFR